MSCVLESAEYIVTRSNYVQINNEGVSQIAGDMTPAELSKLTSPDAFMSDIHFKDEEQLTVQYLLVVDALNFCFWPDGELEYEDLSGGLKVSLQGNPRLISAERLATIDGPGVRALLGWKRDLPLQAERARLLREVGQGLLANFGGQAANLITAAGQSAQKLVELVTTHFPGFRDHAVYKGRQVFFYKRAQIFVGDVWGACHRKGLGCFHDIHTLTMFADYRVPVVLRVLGVLDYAPELEGKVQSGEEIPAGSEMECEIRAACIVAVERIRQALEQRFPGQACPAALQLDWWMWEQGEKARHSHPPHHKTLTTYY